MCYTRAGFESERYACNIMKNDPFNAHLDDSFDGVLSCQPEVTISVAGFASTYICPVENTDYEETPHV